VTRRPATALLGTAAALLAAALAWPALAADPAPVDQRPAWASLTGAQQTALAPLQRDWAKIDTTSKQKWLELARRFPTMPAPERQRVQERMAEWARMTPTERGRARLQFQETRQFSPEDRQARWEAYKALPDDERQKLAHQGVKPAPRPTSAADARPADANAKRNLVPTTRQALAKPVAPTLVQAKPGATTTLMSTRPPPPAHEQPGLPKITATEGFVNRNTLLPSRGPQGAAVQASVASQPPRHP
jgi:hypothetical protein